MKLLVGGGAGFIGGHLVRALLQQGHAVTVIDSLESQVHGTGCEPINVPEGVRFHPGRIGSLDLYEEHVCKERYDVVFHLAAVVGVGQSQYEIDRYNAMNIGDTGKLLDYWVRHPEHRPGRLIVASSMSVYGEGGNVGVTEDDTCIPPNIYALTKYVQERESLIFGETYDIPTTCMRFFGVYGEGQALSNPYTGVMAIFAQKLLSHSAPVIFEDGKQTRDFIHVSDIVQGLLLGMTASTRAIEGQVFNLGTGVPHNLLTVADLMARALGIHIRPNLTHTKRKGDIRHCWANITKAREILDFCPKITLEAGIRGYAEYLRMEYGKTTPVPAAGDALTDLVKYGLLTRA